MLATPAFSPLYQQIKGLILQSLQAGEWKPGEAIPAKWTWPRASA
jgi:GntR family transcriptional regulator